MKLSELKVGDRVTVKRYGYEQDGTVLEVGTFTKRVYRGSRDWSGSMTTLSGARVRTQAEGEGDWYLPQQVVRSAKQTATIRQARAERDAAIKRHSDELTAAFKAAGLDVTVYRAHDGEMRFSGLAYQSTKLLEVLKRAAL